MQAIVVKTEPLALRSGRERMERQAIDSAS